MAIRPINWVECKEPCADCPYDTNNTSKADCIHPWRHEIKELADLYQDDPAPFDTPERLARVGATVSRVAVEGKRPSVQVFEDEPLTRDGYTKLRIEN